MKIRKNGKTYNTETAKVIAHYENDYSYNDFRWQEETLYQKKDGTMFMICEGGAMTSYCHYCGDGTRCGGTWLLVIAPGDEQEAMEYVNSDRHFGEITIFDKYYDNTFSENYGYWGYKNLSYTWIRTNCFEI